MAASSTPPYSNPLSEQPPSSTFLCGRALSSKLKLRRHHHHQQQQPSTMSLPQIPTKPTSTIL